MSTIEQWLNEYRENHQHPKNIAVHYLSTPLSLLGVLGGIWSLSIPVLALMVVLYLAFYFVLSRPMFVGIAILMGLLVFLVYWINLRVQIPLRLVSVAFLGMGWLLQFLAHSVEGKRTRVARMPILMLIGPAFLLWPVYKLFKVKL